MWPDFTGVRYPERQAFHDASLDGCVLRRCCRSCGQWHRRRTEFDLNYGGFLPMLHLLTNTWLAGNQLSFFLLQGARDRGASSGTEDFSYWNTTQKMKWPALVVAIVIGFIVGLVARRLISDKEPMGIIITIILGIAGSLAGRWRAITACARPCS